MRPRSWARSRRAIRASSAATPPPAMTTWKGCECVVVSMAGHATSAGRHEHRGTTAGSARKNTDRSACPRRYGRAMEASETRDGVIRIVLADDHTVVRRGLQVLLEAEHGLEVVASVGDVDA